MAKAKDGLFGKLSGKVGNVVIASWKGIPYIRSRPSRNPSNSPKQQLQRNKFTVVRLFVDSILPVIRKGFKRNSDEMTERNAAQSYNMKNAVKKEEGKVWLDFSEVLVARGNLPAPGEVDVERKEEELIFRWPFDAELGPKRGNDHVLALAYCPEQGQGVWAVDSRGSRKDEGLSLSIPEDWKELRLHTYLAFADPQNNDASDSVYGGEV